MILALALTVAMQVDGGATRVKTASETSAPVTSEKKICRTMVTTGSIMSKKSCVTKAEWKKLQDSTDAAWETARAKRGFVTRDPNGDF